MKRATRNAMRWIIGILLTAGTIGLYAAFMPRERLLLNEAKQIPAITQDLAPFSYSWLSNHAVILIPFFAEGDRKFIQLDADTGNQTSLDALNHKYRSMLNASTSHVEFDHESQSPDRKWLILYRYLPTVPYVEHIAINLDGKKSVQWRTGEMFNPPLWLHHMPACFQIAYDADTTGNGAEQRVALRDRDSMRPTRRIYLAGFDGGEQQVGVTPEDRLLQIDFHNAPNASVRMADYGLLSPPTAAHRHVVRLPMSSNVCEVKLSPHGDRLAWLLEYDSASPLPKWLRRLWPSSPFRSQKMLGLWVSRLDGAGMTEIGHKPALPKTGHQDANDLQWLPDGKLISFIYQDVLYTVAAP